MRLAVPATLFCYEIEAWNYLESRNEPLPKLSFQNISKLKFVAFFEMTTEKAKKKNVCTLTFLGGNFHRYWQDSKWGLIGGRAGSEGVGLEPNLQENSSLWRSNTRITLHFFQFMKVKSLAITQIWSLAIRSFCFIPFSECSISSCLFLTAAQYRLFPSEPSNWDWLQRPGDCKEKCFG